MLTQNLAPILFPYYSFPACSRFIFHFLTSSPAIHRKVSFPSVAVHYALSISLLSQHIFSGKLNFIHSNPVVTDFEIA